MTYDQDFKEKVKEIAKDYWPEFIWKEDFEKLLKFAKRIYNMEH